MFSEKINDHLNKQQEYPADDWSQVYDIFVFLFVKIDFVIAKIIHVLCIGKQREGRRTLRASEVSIGKEKGGERVLGMKMHRLELYALRALSTKYYNIR